MEQQNAPYTPPEFEKESFNCPFCQTFAHQTWNPVSTDGVQKLVYPRQYDVYRGPRKRFLYVCQCFQCEYYSLWLDHRMIFPLSSTAPPPNPDLPDDIKMIYEEARGISQRSPRGAAALLRLAIEKLCKQLCERIGEKGGSLNQNIAILVKNDLPRKVQQLLDSVRVFGNDLVHSGEIVLDETEETSNLLFRLVNIVANRMITEQKEIDGVYDTLPKPKREAIEKRDKRKTK